MPEPYRLTGEVDLLVADFHFDELMIYASRVGGELLIDCAEMTFLDSSGLEMLVRLQRALPATRIQLNNVRPQCILPLEVSGLDELFLGTKRDDDSGPLLSA